jgi:hypothetical protein
MTPEQQNIVLVDTATIQIAEQLLEGCEACTEEAEVPFDIILDGVKGSDTSTSDYLLERPAKCPKCFREVREKTLVVAGNMDSDTSPF